VRAAQAPSTVVGTVSGDALTLGTPPVTAVYAGAPLPCNKSVRETLTMWINGGGWLAGDGSVLGQIRTGLPSIYRGF
jgi:hypothetical protein